MAKYRNNLPQYSGGTFLTDGGMETTLIFHDGIELPHFASFVLLDTLKGRALLKKYYESYLAIAHRHSVGFVLDTPTWRANSDWGDKLGYDAAALHAINTGSISFLRALRAKWEQPSTPCVISGAIGPRGDGYVATSTMTADEARAYHLPQINSFLAAGADMATAFTLNYVEEGIGVALAAKSVGLPVAISFTLETDGLLPDGTTLAEAIRAVDDASGGYPVYYMINCAHPTHFVHILDTEEPWVKRIRGIRGNASTRSHAELDSSPDLDAGDPTDFGLRYSAMRNLQAQLTILGGCCGTDCRHIDQIRISCLAA